MTTGSCLKFKLGPTVNLSGPFRPRKSSKAMYDGWHAQQY